jgi:hypothetical protein
MFRRVLIVRAVSIVPRPSAAKESCTLPRSLARQFIGLHPVRHLKQQVLMLEPTAAEPLSDAPEGLSAGLIAGLIWSPQADPELSARASTGDSRRLAKRLVKTGLPRPRRLKSGLATNCELQLHSLPAEGSNALEHLTRETLAAVTANASRGELSNHVTALLDAADETEGLSPGWLSAWLSLLPVLARGLEPAVTLRFWLRTLLFVRQWQRHGTDTDADPASDAELRDEILFRAGIVFSPLAEGDEWFRAGRDGWRGRLAQVGADWALSPADPSQARVALAALVRTHTDAAAFERTLWKKSQAADIRRLAARIAALLLIDGSLAGLRGEREENLPLLWNLVRLSGWERDSLPAQCVADVVRERATKPSSASPPVRKPSRPAYQSDAARFALLRSNWSTTSPVCSVDYAGSDVVLEASIAGQRWLTGVWTASISIDGQRRELTSGWKCDCWFSDRDTDFLEISTPVEPGVSLMRQILLGRRDRVMLLVEAVRGLDPARTLAITSIVPLAEGLAPEADGVSREVQISLRNRCVRAFPLHLPWERTAAADGSLRLMDDGLQLAVSGGAMRCQMLLCDWSRRRGDEPSDGAVLAVAERGQHVAPTDSSAARVRIGDRQWFYWHNLTAGGVPRSCLGHHCDHETVFGRFQPEGALDILVHVESPSLEENPAK